jgi:hypothetical protein
MLLLLSNYRKLELSTGVAAEYHAERFADNVYAWFKKNIIGKKSMLKTVPSLEDTSSTSMQPPNRAKTSRQSKKAK